MHERPVLAGIQHWVQTVITHPEGVPAGLAAAGGSHSLPGEAAGDVVIASRRLAPEERLAIYHHGYFRRLLECMQAMYPALRHALGSDLFDQFTLDYLGSYPSTGPSLFDLAGNFTRHLSDTRPQDEEWPDFIIDLARLERAFFVVYDGPGTEGEHLLDGTDGWPRPDVRLPATRLTPSPALRLLDFRYPVVPYFQAVRRGEHPDLPQPHMSWAVLNRLEYVVRITELTEQQHRVLAALISGMPVAAALGEAGETDPAAALAWTVRWAELGFFASSPGTDDRSEALAEVSRRRPSPQSKGGSG